MKIPSSNEWFFYLTVYSAVMMMVASIVWRERHTSIQKITVLRGETGNPGNLSYCSSRTKPPVYQSDFWYIIICYLIYLLVSLLERESDLRLLLLLSTRLFLTGIGRYHFLPLATILTNTFRFFHCHQIPHTRSPVSGSPDLALL
jgi:hypothetical protein